MTSPHKNRDLLIVFGSVQRVMRAERAAREASLDVDAAPAPRKYEHYVAFETPFSAPPVLHTGISGFDIDNRDSSRLSVRAEDISANGFKLVIETLMHTRVYKVDVSWLALGSA